MDFNKENFYYFGWAQKRGEILFKPLNDYKHQEFMLSKYKPQEPFEVKIGEGKKMYDIIHLQDPYNFSISERVHDLLKESDLTGWSSYEIKIQDKEEKYFGFQVTGRCGNLIRPKESGFYIGYKFDYETWDKSDFFCPKDTLHIFCSERVMQFFKKNKVTNYKLEDINLCKAYKS